MSSGLYQRLVPPEDFLVQWHMSLACFIDKQEKPYNKPSSQKASQPAKKTPVKVQKIQICLENARNLLRKTPIK